MVREPPLRNKQILEKVMQKYGLLGYPLDIRFPKLISTRSLKRKKIDAQYVNFEIPNIKEIKMY